MHAVIVHHRGLEMLDVCLRSLLDSASVDLQIIIVNNGCREPLPDIADTSPRIHVAKPPEPVGFSEANNVGARWAAQNLGPAHAYYFVNNDTESKPATLDFLLKALDEHRAAIAGPLTLIHAAPDHINSVGIRITEDAGAWDDGIGIPIAQYGPMKKVREVAAVTGSALLIKADVFEELGGWNEVYGWYYEDIDLCLSAWKRGHKVIHVSKAVILHRISATMSEGSERKIFYFRRNRLLIGLLHWPADVLRTLLWRAIYHEILRAPKAHSVMHRKALKDIIRQLPRYWRLRRRGRGDDSWRRFIEPLGSVPPISLPDLTTADDGAPEAPTAAVAAAEAEAATPTARQLELAKHFDDARTHRARPGRRRYLVLGWGPLPGEPATMHFAPGGRTWQLSKALADDGHQVVVATARMPGSGDEPADLETPPRHLAPNLLHYRFEREVFEGPDALRALADAFQPDGLVAAAPVPCLQAVRMGVETPIWEDLFGDPMSEAQAKAIVDGGDHLSAYMQLVHAILNRADAFSAVSERQQWAVVGQLGLAGRLNKEVGGTALVHTIPCASLSADNDDVVEGGPPKKKGAQKKRPPAKSIEALKLPKGAVVALWSGSFNTWCDIDTLFAGVEKALNEESKLVFVATGGAVTGHDEKTYQLLLDHLEGSSHRDRWHLLGALPKDEFSALRERADLGVVTEKPLYERLLGSSGRILDWLNAGTPVVCTTLSELGGMVGHGGFGAVYPPGDGDRLAEALLEVARLTTRKRRSMGAAARKHVREHLSIHATTTPLRAWARDPRRAPDAGAPRADYLLAAGREAVREEYEHALAEAARFRAENLEFVHRHHQLRGELGDIHNSSMWRLWSVYHRLRRFLSNPLGGGR
ncbi:MAG: glycosyltransferase [Acidobacteriota bacterium]